MTIDSTTGYLVLVFALIALGHLGAEVWRCYRHIRTLEKQAEGKDGLLERERDRRREDALAHTAALADEIRKTQGLQQEMARHVRDLRFAYASNLANVLQITREVLAQPATPQGTVVRATEFEKRIRAWLGSNVPGAEGDTLDAEAKRLVGAFGGAVPLAPDDE